MADAPLVMDLLTKNLAKNLSNEEKREGFLFYEPTDKEIAKIINDTGVYLNMRGDILKGYFITMSRELAQTIPFEAELLTNAENMQYDGKLIKDYKYAVLAQICIAKEYRKGGKAFLKLHYETQSSLGSQGYELGVGEIADDNKNSLNVHRFLTDIGTYTALSGLKWHIIVADLAKD